MTFSVDMMLFDLPLCSFIFFFEQCYLLQRQDHLRNYYQVSKLKSDHVQTLHSQCGFQNLLVKRNDIGPGCGGRIPFLVLCALQVPPKSTAFLQFALIIHFLFSRQFLVTVGVYLSLKSALKYFSFLASFLLLHCCYFQGS